MPNERPEPITPTRLDHLQRIELTFGAAPFRADDRSEAGLSRDQMHRLVRTGLLRPLLRGVYQVAGPEVDLAVRAQAVALVLPPGAAIARRTAAWLLGVDPRAPDERGQPMPVECIVPVGHTSIRRPSLRCFVSDVPDPDLSTLDGVLTTGPARTAADLLRWLRPHMGLACADALSAAGLIGADDVLAVLERWPRRRYVRQARQLAEWMEPLTESFGESWLRLRILDAGFPKPTAQVPIRNGAGTELFRLDLGWLDRRIGIEYDGTEFHSGPAVLTDRDRRERLRVEHGWHVVGVGKGEVLGPSLRLEAGVGELLGMAPTTTRRRW
jgi:hypothetical protein